MLVRVNISTNDGRPYNYQELTVDEELYLEQLVCDIDEFLCEQFIKIKEGE